MITGASSGIGKYYAIELARKGLNLVLISKNAVKLEKVDDEISNNLSIINLQGKFLFFVFILEKQCDVSTIVIVADLSTGQDAFKKIWDDIKDLEVGVLSTSFIKDLFRKCVT